MKRFFVFVAGVSLICFFESAIAFSPTFSALNSRIVTTSTTRSFANLQHRVYRKNIMPTKMAEQGQELNRRKCSAYLPMFSL
jgi:hypothetical protein